MTRFLLVAAGGALGSMARFGLGLVAARLAPNTGWPMGTFAANILGGLAMGIVVGWLAFKGGSHEETIRLFAAIGVLGGFTTFSSYALEAVMMIERRDYALAAAYVFGSAVLAVAALFIGLTVARSAFGAAL